MQTTGPLDVDRPDGTQTDGVVSGTVQPGFEPAAEAFRENFSRRGEIGASFCAYHRGQRVVDLWGGVADPASGRPWQAETLCVIFSATKGLASAAVLSAAEAGAIDYDAPVRELWPELAKDSLEDLTLRHLMNHRAGLVALDQPVTVRDLTEPERLLPILESQQPIWPPGERQGYHGISFGLYLPEIFRRATGTTLGRWLADKVTGPLGADAYLGLPEEHAERLATLVPVGPLERLAKLIPWVIRHNTVERRLLRALLDKRSLTSRAFAHPRELGAGGLARFHDPDVRRLELPWAGGIASARGLARVYAALACGGTLDGTTICRPEALRPIEERQSWQAPDAVLLKAMGWSQGFLKEEGGIFSPNPAAFGHPGAGGALGFCDPTRQLAWAYVMNRMDFRLRSPRAIALSQALYRCPAIRSGTT